MKKSKIIALAVLSVILCLMLICSPSFSWFTRGSQTGGYFKWSNNDSETALSYNTSNGDNITMATYSSPDGKTYGEIKATSFSESGGISAGGRKYYRTDIINSGNTAQSVSLYLSGLATSGSGSFNLGLNSPLKTYKSYTASVGKNSGDETERGLKRVYLKHMGEWTGGSTKYYVSYNQRNNDDVSDLSDRVFVEMKFATTDSSDNNEIYYVDIPSGITHFYFADQSGNWQEHGRTEAINDSTLSKKKSYLYTLNGNENTFQNKLVNRSDVESGANIFKYYSSVNMLEDTSFSIGLTKGDTYIGNSIEYTSSDTSVCTVDNSGKLTAVGIGTAQVTIKVTGVYGDTVSVNCNVTVVKNNPDIPIITNLSIPAKSGEKDSVVSVYWYIKNDSESGDLTYTVDDLYISL